MNEKAKTITLRCVKALLCLIGLAALVGFVYHFVRGIYCSCVNDDIITAQDRIKGAYQFLMMIGAGLTSLACFIPTMFIKVPLIPEKATAWCQERFAKAKGLFAKKAKE